MRFPASKGPIATLRAASQRVQEAWNAPEKWAYSRGLPLAAGLCLPEFLCIGAQKAGTTWLYENLRLHPEIYLPDRKEIHYFDRRFHRSLRYYSRFFAPGRGRVKGDITPSYSVLPRRRIQAIFRLLPDLRLIFFLRNPIERAWSHALMEFVKLRGRRYEEVSEAEWLAHFRSEESRRRGDYATLIEEWLSVFPEEQLFVGLFEDIVQRPEALLRDTFRHLGVGQAVDLSAFPFRTRVHAGAGAPLPPKYRAVLEELYAPDLERLSTRMGERVEGWRVRAPATDGSEENNGVREGS
jgi:hypothetical protein